MDKSTGDIDFLIQGLNHLDQGVSIFDNKLQLRLFNKRFQTLFDFPDGLLYVGLHFHDLIRFNISRGEYGTGNPDHIFDEKIRNLDHIRPHRFQRHRPDGTVIDISGTPLPDGGFVTIYTDITHFHHQEQKQKSKHADLERIIAQRTNETQNHKKQLAQKTSWLQATLDHMAQGLLITDSQMQITCANNQLSTLLDLPQDCADEGQSAFNIVSTQAQNSQTRSFLQSVMVHIKNKTAFNNQCHKDDGTILAVCGTPLPGVGYLTTFTDVTATEKAHQNIRAKEEEYRNYLEASPIGVVIASFNGQIRYYNKTFQKLFGYSPQELQTLNIARLHSTPEDREILISLVETNQSVTNLRLTARNKNNVTFPVIISAQKIEIDGSPHLVSWILDSSDQDEAEKTIQQLSQHNQFILEAAGAGIVGLDEQCTIRFINPAAAALLSYTNADLQGQDISLILEHATDLRFRIQYELGTDGQISGENFILTKQGNSLPIHFTLSKIRHDDQEDGMVLVFNDISDRIRAERVMRAAMNEMRKSNEAKSHFLSTMSHELRTPLNAILGFAQILQANPKGNLDDQQKLYIEHLYNAGDHLLRLVNEAIDIAAIESEKIILSKQSVGLRELLSATHRISSELATRKGVTLHPPTHPDDGLFLIADYSRVQQVLIQLISNAIKFNKPNGDVFVTCEQTSPHTARITVKDTGRGIPPDEMNEIFHPFNRLGAQRDGIEGTGLGLTLSKKLVEFMGGTIGVDSKLGEGTSFWFDMPCATDAHIFVKEVEYNPKENIY